MDPYRYFRSFLFLIGGMKVEEFIISNEIELYFFLNQIEKFDIITLYKSVRSDNGFFNKLRLGKYNIFDGEYECKLICSKELLSAFRLLMEMKGYKLIKGKDEKKLWKIMK